MINQSWRNARRLAQEANQSLTPALFEQLLDLYRREYLPGGLTPIAFTSEWEKNEFLRVVQEDGTECLPITGMLRAFEQEQPDDFHRWFRLDTLKEGPHAGQPVLLAARWLCHLIGLRHITVEIFIDPPHLPGHTLVQVRGMQKFEAPGSFDIPCAGHVSGVDGIEESLRKELGEEINLTAEDLEGVRLSTRYNSVPKRVDDGPLNYEYRYLYFSRLKPESAAKIRFTDQEVAGMCVFSVPELRALAERFPERIASGLGDALAYYS